MRIMICMESSARAKFDSANSDWNRLDQLNEWTQFKLIADLEKEVTRERVARLIPRTTGVDKIRNSVPP